MKKLGELQRVLGGLLWPPGGPQMQLRGSVATERAIGRRQGWGEKEREKRGVLPYVFA